MYPYYHTCRAVVTVPAVDGHRRLPCLRANESLPTGHSWPDCSGRLIGSASLRRWREVHAVSYTGQFPHAFHERAFMFAAGLSHVGE